MTLARRQMLASVVASLAVGSLSRLHAAPLVDTASSTTGQRYYRAIQR